MAEDADRSEAPLPEDEVTGGAVVGIQSGYERLRARWRRWAWSPTGPDTPLPWRVCLYTALAILAIHAPVSVIGHIQYAHRFAANYPDGYPLLSRTLSSLVDFAWRGFVYGLALVLADRWAGQWRRTVRWGIALGLVTIVHDLVLRGPSSWQYQIQGLFHWGPRALIDFHWFGFPWLTVEGAAKWAFFGYWVARAIRPDGTPTRGLHWAGFEGRLIPFLAFLPIDLVVTLSIHFEPPVGLAMRALGVAFGIVEPCLEGACLGYALGLVLPRRVPKPEPEAVSVTE